MLLIVLLLLGIGFVFVVIVGIYVMVTYNNFVTLNERVDNGKAQIATQIESRWDAVSNLISATKQYAAHESKVLENITEKRAAVGQNSSVKDLEASDGQLEQVVGRLLAISESYPELKASDVYQNAMGNVEKFENHVRHARMIYNDVVTKLNRRIKMFPSNFVAKLFRFKERVYFESTEEKETMPSWD